MLIKYSPLRRGFLNQGRDLERLFDQFVGFGRQWPESSLTLMPTIDIEETSNEYKVSAELPGLEKNDIKVSIENNVLTISGEKKAEQEINEENFHRLERNYGKFQRCVELPSLVDRDKIEADYKNGVLYIVLPKAEEVKPKQIEIKVK